MASEEELRAARRAHAAQLRNAGTQPFPNDYRADETRRRAAVTLLRDAAARATLPQEAELAPDAQEYPLYGRVVAKRGPFVVIRTPYGDAQALVRDQPAKGSDPEKAIYVRDPNEAAQLALVDLADHIGVEGPLIRTRTGDGAVLARRYRHLGKAILPPPDKWHGLTDVEKRYRERYVDLFANPDIARVFRARSTIVRALRAFLDGNGFLEVETPLLHPLRGGAVARPFETHHHTLDMHLYLRIAPELYLKRLVAGGLDRVYEIGRCFRNEGISTKHNPEFTMLEYYFAYATFADQMALTEAMLRSVDHAVRPELDTATLDARTFDLDAPFARVKMRDAIAQVTEYAGDRNDLAALVAHARERVREAAQRETVAKTHSDGEALFVLYEYLVEPRLPELYRTADGTKSVPVFILEYPVEVSPLSRKNDADPRFADRFELFVEGREIGNGFSEINDPDDQAERFRGQLDQRARGDEEAMDFDADYIRALEHGMPFAAGCGIGVDRLTMLLCAQPSIRDVLLFPLLRPEGAAP